MRSSNKSRSRNKNNNNRRSNPTNVLNRVFDSSGPEGKVRGTPQQIIDKYQSLASDAMLSGDRVNSENFLQHSEHYSRLLTEAQREIDERREAQEAQRQQQNQQPQNQQQQQQNQQPQNQNKPQHTPKPAVEAGNAQPDVAGDTSELFPGQDNAPSGLVETPESKTEPAVKAKKPSKPRKPAEKKTVEKIELAPPQAEPTSEPG